MVTRAVRRQLMRAISQRALLPRARDNVLMTLGPGGTQCDTPSKPQTVPCLVYWKRIKGSMSYITSQGSFCKLDTSGFTLQWKKKNYHPFVTVSFVPLDFSYFPSASPAHSQQLFILFVCLSYSVEQEKSCRQHCLKW